MSTDHVLGGRYELHEILGRGGMAAVYRGRDTFLERWVAIKVLHAALARDPLVRSRFRREAQTVAGLNHPGIVSVYDVGQGYLAGGDPDDPKVPFLVMELVDGQSLRERLREGELSLDESVRFVLGLLSALDFSHRAGVVHRDIKPANVMLTPDDEVKIVDFGISRLDDDAGATVTQALAFVGTALYLSPEQGRGEVADARSDLYAAGCLLFELLTGRPPFAGENAVSLAYQHVYTKAPRASASRAEITPALDAVVRTALAKKRKERFQTAREFSEALEAAAAGVAEGAVKDQAARGPARSRCGAA